MTSKNPYSFQDPSVMQVSSQSTTVGAGLDDPFGAVSIFAFDNLFGIVHVGLGNWHEEWALLGGNGKIKLRTKSFVEFRSLNKLIIIIAWFIYII